MMDRQPISNLISMGIGSIITLLIIFSVYKALDSFVVRNLDVKYRSLRNEAVDQCMKEARSVVANVFNDSLYRVCLQDKGFATSFPK
jgi:hypothetical protein